MPKLLSLFKLVVRVLGWFLLLVTLSTTLGQQNPDATSICVGVSLYFLVMLLLFVFSDTLRNAGDDDWRDPMTRKESLRYDAPQAFASLALIWVRWVGVRFEWLV